MRKLLIALPLLAMACGDTNTPGRLVIQSAYGTVPTCATATADGDLCVADAIEANGALDVGGAVTLTGAVTLGAGVTMVDDADITLGTGSDAIISFDAATQAPDSLFVGVGTESRQLVIGETADIGTDLTIAQQTNPTLNIHSADATDALDYVTLAHDQTDGVIDVGQGDVKIADACTVAGDTLTSGGTDDYSLNITQVLNDSGAAGGSDLYNGIKLNVTETDVTGWDTVNLMDLQVGGAGKFTVTNAGAVTAASSVTSTTSQYVLSQADLDGTCTLGQLRIDTGGATAELCYCQATDTEYCISMTTLTGPTD